jgi:hypothetical protein
MPIRRENIVPALARRNGRSPSGKRGQALFFEVMALNADQRCSMFALSQCGQLFGILLIAGFKIRMASVLSGLLLLSFAMGMGTGLGIKTPFDYSVFSAAAAAFLLAFWEPDRFTLDKLLNRSRN